MANTLFSAFFKRQDWAVREVYSHYSRLVKHVSFEILHDNDLADDIVSETFIHLLEKKKSRKRKELCRLYVRSSKELILEHD